MHYSLSGKLETQQIKKRKEIAQTYFLYCKTTFPTVDIVMDYSL